jgi:hypothetical protein
MRVFWLFKCMDSQEVLSNYVLKMSKMQISINISHGFVNI